MTERATFAGAATQVVEYEYDAFNRLIRKELDADGDGAGTSTETFWVYDGDQAVLEFDGGTAADLSHRYLWGPAVDQLLADETVDDGGAEDVLWPLGDWQGSVRHLATYDASTDVTTIANEKVYDAFGNVSSETNSAVDTIFGYTGRMWDDDTGLQNNLNRWYDPGVGRWLSEDPIGFAAGDPNLYRYVGNSPGMGVDPSGLAGRPSVITDLAPDRARDAVIARHTVEIVDEMKAENWIPSNPDNPGEFGNEFERRLNARLAKDGPRGTNNFYSDVCVEGGTGKVLKIGGGPGAKDTVQVDVVYYRGKLKVGDTIDKSRVIDVYDAKTGRVHMKQMEKVEAVTGKKVKIIAPPEKWTSGGGWRAVESVQKKLKFFKALGAGLTVLAFITTRVEAREIDHLICEREKAGNDMTKIQVWANAELRSFVDSFIQENAATHLVVQFYIGQEKARLER